MGDTAGEGGTKKKKKGGMTQKCTVESWLDESGHSLVPLSNPGSDPEVCLENGEHGNLLGR